VRQEADQGIEDIMEACQSLVEVLDVQRHRWFFGLGGSQAILPAPLPETELYVFRSAPGGQELRLVEADGAAMEGLEGDVRFVRVRTSAQPLDMVFAALLEGGNAHKWDLRLKGSWSIVDCRKFLKAYGLEAALPGSGLAGQLAESWIANSLGSHVRDAVRDQSIEDLREKDALPARWWEAQMLKWLRDCGVAVKIAEVQWQSAEAANWEAEQARLKDLARIEQERERQRQAELQEEASRANYAKEKARIEADLTLSEKERGHQLQVLELRHRKELVQAETEIENAKRAAEKALLEHEATIARLRNDVEAAKLAKVREEESDQQHRELTERLAEMQRVLEKLAVLPENLLSQLADRDARRSHDAKERVTQLSGVTARQLADLGFAVAPQLIVQNLRDKAVADREPVVIRKAELGTRDIGTKRVKALPINTSLQFEFSTQRAGYATLLNIGTSGSVYLHVPSAYIGPSEAKVVAGRSYMIPGSELLPWDRLQQIGLDYVEVGPPGWEHIAVLVSDEPVVAPRVSARSTSESPFVKLTPEEVDEFCGVLTERPAGSWSAAVLSFLVG
jgi:hypothetical protein